MTVQNAQPIRGRLFSSTSRFPDSIFGQGCSIRGTPAGFKYQIFFGSREWSREAARRSAAFFVRAFEAAISGFPGLGKKAIGLPIRRFNQILTQNIRHSKPGTVIDVVTCRPCEQGVSDGFFRALLCRPHRRGIFGRDRYRDLDVDALSRAPSRRRSGHCRRKKPPQPDGAMAQV